MKKEYNRDRSGMGRVGKVIGGILLLLLILLLITVIIAFWDLLQKLTSFLLIPPPAPLAALVSGVGVAVIAFFMMSLLIFALALLEVILVPFRK